MENKLLVIPISHYCEKARWALQRAQIPFSEIRHLQGFHYFYSFKWAGSPSLPVFFNNEILLRDSDDILRWANQNMAEEARIYPSDKSLELKIRVCERELNEDLGPAGRLWMYTHMLDKLEVILNYSRIHQVPLWQIKLMPFLFPLLKPFIHWRLKRNPNSQEETKRIVDEIFAKIATIISDGRPFLFGENFSAADLTFAALSASVLLPSQYGVTLPTLEEVPEKMAEQIKKWRAHPAGQFALKIYARQRNI